jgi:hypothetical protein
LQGRAITSAAERLLDPLVPEDDRLFVSHLTDLVAALVWSAPSRSTRRLLDLRAALDEVG